MAWQRGAPAGLAGAASLDGDSGWRAQPFEDGLRRNRKRLSGALNGVCPIRPLSGIVFCSGFSSGKSLNGKERRGSKRRKSAVVPANPLNRYITVDADHLGTPTASRDALLPG